MPFRSKPESQTRHSSIRPTLTFRVILQRYQRRQTETQVSSSTWSQTRQRGEAWVLFLTKSLKNKCQIKWLKQKYHCCLTGSRAFPSACWFVRKALMLKDRRWSSEVHDPNKQWFGGGVGGGCLQMGAGGREFLGVEVRDEASELKKDFDFLTSNLFLQSSSHSFLFLVTDSAPVRWINSDVSKEHHVLGRGHRGN